MNEEKQKIISDICPFYREYGTCEQCNTELDTEDNGPCYFECVANAIINTNYRKQSEGEWIDDDTWAADMYRYRCSICGNYEFLKENYCSNCGAKMKGGAE